MDKSSVFTCVYYDTRVDGFPNISYNLFEIRIKGIGNDHWKRVGGGSACAPGTSVAYNITCLNVNSYCRMDKYTLVNDS